MVTKIGRIRCVNLKFELYVDQIFVSRGIVNTLTLSQLLRIILKLFAEIDLTLSASLNLKACTTVKTEMPF